MLNTTFFKCIILYLSLVIAISSCKYIRGKYLSPNGYNLTKPHILKLPIELDEISGIYYYPKDSSLFSINDERGWLYKIYLSKPGLISKWHYFHNGDYEDVVLLDSAFYVLESSGKILAFKFPSNDSVIIKENYFFENSQNEFESLYFDSSTNTLKMICKDCESDKKKFLSVYEFDPSTYTYNNKPFRINVKKVAALLNKKSIKLKPSAASIHPITKDLYIVSAVNKLLIVADRYGNAKNIYELDPSLFKQPEGIAFNLNGDMYISNEAADIGVADILYYKYKPQKKVK